MSVVNEQEKALIRLLQDDLPITPRPFEELGKQLGLSEGEVLRKIKDLKARGLIRRFGAAVRHREMGFIANAMVVWQVDPEEAQALGEKMAAYPEVSHCYQRPPLPGWPYRLFTMIHGRGREDCEEVAARMARELGLTDFRLLYSTAELKKTSPKYFLEEG